LLGSIELKIKPVWGSGLWEF